MTVHDLKCIQPWFDYVCNGVKPFEVRKNDRGYWKGDLIRLHEFNPHGPEAIPGIRAKAKEFGIFEGEGYTGRNASFEITIVVDHEDVKGIQPGYCVLGLKEIPVE